MFEKLVVVDCRGHLLGRLASTVAKELLCGQHIVLVRAEEMNVSGNHFRNKLKLADQRNKRMNTNPKRGPYHPKAPSKLVWKIIRGMLPHKTARGQAALGRLKVFDGVPTPYDTMKRQVIPHALRVVRLRPDRKYTTVGKLASETGWTHADLIERLENKRKAASEKYYARKKELNRLWNQAKETVGTA